MELELRPYCYGSADYQKGLILRNCVLSIQDGINDLSLDSVFGDHSEEQSEFFLGAFYGDSLVGTVNLQPEGEQLLLRQFAVFQKQQGKGIGRQLLQYAHDYARAKGYHRIVLEARIPAIAFYERNGYTLTGKVIECTQITLKEMDIDL